MRDKQTSHAVLDIALQSRVRGHDDRAPGGHRLEDHREPRALPGVLEGDRHEVAAGVAVAHLLVHAAAVHHAHLRGYVDGQEGGQFEAQLRQPQPSQADRLDKRAVIAHAVVTDAEHRAHRIGRHRLRHEELAVDAQSDYVQAPRIDPETVGQRLDHCRALGKHGIGAIQRHSGQFPVPPREFVRILEPGDPHHGARITRAQRHRDARALVHGQPHVSAAAQRVAPLGDQRKQFDAPQAAVPPVGGADQPGVQRAAERDHGAVVGQPVQAVGRFVRYQFIGIATSPIGDIKCPRKLDVHPRGHGRFPALRIVRSA